MSETNIKLSPPWYIYANKVKYTYGQSDLIQVNDLIECGSSYLLIINAFDSDVALALRQILPTTITMGNIKLNIVIFDSLGKAVNVIDTSSFSPQNIAQLFDSALQSNPLFIGTVVTDEILSSANSSLVGDVVIVIDKSIVQFFNDDISDLCQNYNEVASKVFKEISQSSFGNDLRANFSTYDDQCQYVQDLL